MLIQTDQEAELPPQTESRGRRDDQRQVPYILLIPSRFSGGGACLRIEVLWGPHIGDPSPYELGEGALVVPDNLIRWPREIEESGCCVNALASVLIRGGGGGGSRLPCPLLREFLGQSPTREGSWPSNCLD